MNLIAHRGNTFGRKVELENSPAYIRKALAAGYDVEIDVWSIDGEFFLGHDEPNWQYRVDPEFLMNQKMWCHAKNAEALYRMRDFEYIHCFWHQDDDYTMTSRGIVWTYPNKKIIKNSVIVMCDNDDLPNDYELNHCLIGICSDMVAVLKEEIEKKFSD